jgi:hypothetical protein
MAAAVIAATEARFATPARWRAIAVIGTAIVAVAGVIGVCLVPLTVTERLAALSAVVALWRQIQKEAA